MTKNKVWQKTLFLGILSATSAFIWRLWRHSKIKVDVNELDLSFTTASPHLLDRNIFMGERRPQLLAEGFGALFYRRYFIDIQNVEQSKSELMSNIKDNLNSFAPSDMAIFERLENFDAPMTVGDDYFIHISGPWQGPVRVIEVSPTSFSFITLEDHLEAGEIQFRIVDSPQQDNLTRFEIRSWSRSRDSIINFMYDVIPIIKFSQERMWVYFCQRVLEISEGKQSDDIQIATHRVPYTHISTSKSNQKLDRWQQYQPQLWRMRDYGLNFDLDQRETFTEVNGWRIDNYEIDLPQESVGMPEKGGSWQLAKQVLLNYEFPDPTLITGIFVPDDPLEDRIMLLEARFLIFVFRFGVRISSVIDDQRTDDEKGEAKVWGYSYQTLEGHFEMGEITFEIWKFLETGKVEFRIHSFSKTGHIANPFYRLGFALFGRQLQKRFATTALSRTQELVTKRLTMSENEPKKPEVQTMK